uniref:Uncharacterized protein n=1 Tax=Panagrolaimus superbus TaxID=310955 RepID=A0A914YQZ2_9BILA
MDLSDLQSTNSTETMPNNIVDNSSVITPSKRDIFLSAYHHQRFTLPNSIMHLYCQRIQKNTYVYLKND